MKYLRYIIPILAMAPLAASAATLSLSPSSGSYNTGDTISVDVLLNTESVQIDGVDIRYITYDPAMLEVQDMDTTKAGLQIQANGLMPNTPLNAVYSANGKIDFGQITSGGTRFTNSSPQALAAIKFRALKSGTASLMIDHALGKGTDSNVAAAGKDVLASASNASFTITGNPVAASYNASAYTMPSNMTPPMPPVAPPIGKYTFPRNLRVGATGEDVRELQRLLNAKGFVVAQSGPGAPGSETTYFGQLTLKAVIRFQEAHAAEILTPNGLSKGTGYFGPSTRQYVNNSL